MNTTNNRKKSVIAAVGAAVAAAAIPAVLFSGAGTAQALTTVDTTTDALGVSVLVTSNKWFPSYGWCTYTAEPQNLGEGIPVYKLPFYLQKGGTHKLWFPGIQTGAKWNVDVDCEHGPDNGPEVETY